MDATTLAKKYLADSRVMQVATLHAGKPWICTVYYVHDADNNLYWLSLPSRLHSQDIAAAADVAIAIAVQTDQPVIGLQAQGKAQIVQDAATVQRVLPRYIAKFGQGQDFYDNFVADTNQHALYKFSPEKYELFDEQNFGDGLKHHVHL